MESLRPFVIFSWIALPTVMFGGYSLFTLLTRGGWLTPFREQFFRAGHAHAGVLLVMSLVYYSFLGQTTLDAPLKIGASVVLVLGVLMQSGGFFLHMGIGKPGQRSAGYTVTTVGAVLLAVAVLFLVYGLIAAWPAAS